MSDGPKHLAVGARRSARDRAFIGLGAAVSFLLFAGAGVAGYFNYRLTQIERFDVTIDVAPASGEPRNYLVVGSDSRAGLDPDDPANAVFFDDEGTVTADNIKRTDTIMVLRVAPDEGTAALLSFPRDLYVPIAGTGDRNRINVAFTRGEDVLIATIRENFGIPIHHYVEVDFAGFKGLVDAIGGVPMYFDEPVRDTHSGLSITDPGCVSLDSSQALSFARSRFLEVRDEDTGRWRTDPTGDLGRISRQQELIRKAISKAVSKGLSNPATLRQLVDVGIDNVGLDPTLDVSDILALGRRFAAFDADTLQTYSLPTKPTRTRAGAAVELLVEREAEPIFNVFRGIDPDEVTPGLVEVQVLNGTGVDGFAGDVSAALDEIGFTTVQPGDTAEPYDESAIFYAEGSEDHAALVARHLSGPVRFGIDEDLGAGQVVLVAGDDFTTLHDQPSPTVPDLPTTTTAEADATSATSATSVVPSTTSTTAPVGYVPNDSPAAAACS